MNIANNKNFHDIPNIQKKKKKKNPLPNFSKNFEKSYFWQFWKNSTITQNVGFWHQFKI